MARRNDELSVVLVYEPAVAALAECVARGLADAGADLTVGAVQTVSPDAATSADLVVVGGPATSLRSRGMPAARRSPENTGYPTLRSWLAAVPAVPPRLPRRRGRPSLVATFDTRVTRPGRTHRSTSSQAATWLTRRGYELAGLPMSFLLDGCTDAPAHGESLRAQRWGYGIAEVAIERLHGEPSAWWVHGQLNGTDHSTIVPLDSPGTTRH